MANDRIVTCKTCGQEIAKSAKVCPNCGAKTKRSKLPIIIAVLVVLFIIGVSGGGSKSSKKAESSSQTSTEAQQAPAQEAAAPEQVQEAAPEDHEFAVSIDACQLGTDWGGDPCVYVYYTFTNVSHDTPQSFVWAVHDEVYQNGVQCESALADYDGDSNQSTNIKAGTSIQVICAYELHDTTGEIEVSCKEAFSFSPDHYAEKSFVL